MSENYYVRSHAKICRALELRSEYESICHDLNLPASKRELVVSTATWFMKRGKVLNENRLRCNQALVICQEYIEISKEKFA